MINKKKHTNLNVKKIGSGLVFGKFLPLHEGHLHLLRFALKSVHRLTILVCSIKSEPIPGEIRYKWVKEMFPMANVVHHYAEIPQEPKEHPDFWNIWNESIKCHCPGEEFDVLFGSEDYGWKMAETMGIEYIPVNRLRNLVPVSGTAIREQPIKNWKYLPAIVRPYFLKRICIVGPESTGKSTLTKKLAEHYQTVFVDEYARQLLDEYVVNKGRCGGEVQYEDISTIARGQMASEDSLANYANKIIFCDTDLFTTVFWSKFYFKRCPKWIKEEAMKRKYDLYLLLSPDVPWVSDPQRPMPRLKERQNFFEWWKKKLIKEKRPFAVIEGGWQNRFKKATSCVDAILELNLT